MRDRDKASNLVAKIDAWLKSDAGKKFACVRDGYYKPPEEGCVGCMLKAAASELRDLQQFHDWAQPQITDLNRGFPGETSTERRFTGVGELERTGYIPAGSAAERETVAKPFAGLLSWGLRPALPQCELSIHFESVEAAQAAREVIRNLIDWQPSPKTGCSTPSASTDDGATSGRDAPTSLVECPKCRTQLAFEGDVCGLCE